MKTTFDFFQIGIWPRNFQIERWPSIGIRLELEYDLTFGLDLKTTANDQIGRQPYIFQIGSQPYIFQINQIPY